MTRVTPVHESQLFSARTSRHDSPWAARATVAVSRRCCARCEALTQKLRELEVQGWWRMRGAGVVRWYAGCCGAEHEGRCADSRKADLTKPSADERERARRLLAHEGATGGSSEACATAAARVYDKLNAEFGLLLGSAGAQALFVRSAKLGRLELAGLAEVSSLDSSTTLAAFIRTLDPAVAANAAEALFGTFLSLVRTFLGERLAFQALRSAWPTIEAPAATENTT